MIVIKDKLHLQLWREKLEPKQLPLGFVPTMGALHIGHASLFKKAKEECETVIASIFVNPLQFNNPADLAAYPRNIEKDIQFLKKLEIDAVYIPDSSHFYKQDPLITIDFGEMGKVMEGYYRPGHFNGVAVVVINLFNQVRPNAAYFGLKDLQQFILVRRLTSDLSFDIDIKPVETVRETDGLAMSSRNLRLTTNGRRLAPVLYQALLYGASLLKSGDEVHSVKQSVHNFLDNYGNIRVEYCEIVRADTLEILETFNPSFDVAICIAAYVEEIRLIDNLYLQAIS